jgi:hypothetical protein
MPYQCSAARVEAAVEVAKRDGYEQAVSLLKREE